MCPNVPMWLKGFFINRKERQVSAKEIESYYYQVCYI